MPRDITRLTRRNPERTAGLRKLLATCRPLRSAEAGALDAAAAEFHGDVRQHAARAAGRTVLMSSTAAMRDDMRRRGLEPGALSLAEAAAEGK